MGRYEARWTFLFCVKTKVHYRIHQKECIVEAQYNLSNLGWKSNELVSVSPIKELTDPTSLFSWISY